MNVFIVTNYIHSNYSYSSIKTMYLVVNIFKKKKFHALFKQTIPVSQKFDGRWDVEEQTNNSWEIIFSRNNLKFTLKKTDNYYNTRYKVKKEVFKKFDSNFHNKQSTWILVWNKKTNFGIFIKNFKKKDH